MSMPRSLLTISAPIASSSAGPFLPGDATEQGIGQTGHHCFDGCRIPMRQFGEEPLKTGTPCYEIRVHGCGLCCGVVCGSGPGARAVRMGCETGWYAHAATRSAAVRRNSAAAGGRIRSCSGSGSPAGHWSCDRLTRYDDLETRRRRTHSCGPCTVRSGGHRRDRAAV